MAKLNSNFTGFDMCYSLTFKKSDYFFWIVRHLNKRILYPFKNPAPQVFTTVLN